MTDIKQSSILIIGAGPAGYTAAIYAARANMKPVMVQGMQPGGQLTITTDVENYPGFADPIQGPWLMEQMEAQARHVGTEIIFDTINSVDFSGPIKKAIGDSGTVYEAKTIVIATGAQAKWLDIPSEHKFQGYGVSACATCDGFFYKGKEVAVIGGGNSAMEEALFLTNFASHVTVVHRRNEFRGERILRDRVAAHPKITVIWDHAVEEIIGETEPHLSVTGLRIKHVTDGTTKTLDVHGVFVAIGHTPATSIFKDHVKMDDGGYILTAPDSTATNVPGVFAAGDVKDKIYRQAITAAGMGCMAALEAERYIHGTAEAINHAHQVLSA